MRCHPVAEVVRTSRPRATRVGVAAVLAVLSGCAGDAPAPTLPSATYELREALRVAEPPGLPFSSIRQVAVDEEGALAVLDGMLPHVLLFDEGGVFQRAVGREGEGPGEFASLFRVGRAGPVAWGVDARRRSLSRFDAEGLHVADASAAAGELSGAIPLGPVGPDSVLVVVQESARIRFAMAGRELADARELVALDTSVRMWSVAEGSTSSFNQPLAPYPLAAPWAGGVVVVDRSADGDTPNPGGPAKYRVDWWGPGGHLGSRSIRYEPTGTTEADVRRGLEPLAATSLPDVLVRTGQFGSREEVLASARERMVVPPTLPPVRGGSSGLEPGSVRVEPSGRVWVERWHPAEDGRTVWDLVDRDGPPARALTPPDLRLMAVSRERAWGVLTDSLGVPTLVGYDVVEVESPSGSLPR